jgi:hypothetical protein
LRNGFCERSVGAHEFSLAAFWGAADLHAPHYRASFLFVNPLVPTRRWLWVAAFATANLTIARLQMQHGAAANTTISRAPET